MRYLMLLAATGAALAPPHASRRRGITLRALAADALETKRLQCFSAFDESETRLAMRLIAAAESEEASLADSASEAFASSLARLRQSAFPDAVDAAWRDDELAAWNWTAPLVAACDGDDVEADAVGAFMDARGVPPGFRERRSGAPRSTRSWRSIAPTAKRCPTAKACR